MLVGLKIRVCSMVRMTRTLEEKQKERKTEEEKERKQNAAQITETKTSAEPGCPVPCKDKAFLYLVRFCESWIGFVPFIYR